MLVLHLSEYENIPVLSCCIDPPSLKYVLCSIPGTVGGGEGRGGEEIWRGAPGDATPLQGGVPRGGGPCWAPALLLQP